MARMNPQGSVAAGCTRCAGGVSTFEWRQDGQAFGMVSEEYEGRNYERRRREFRLFRCAGCGRGGLGVFTMGTNYRYPDTAYLERFTPDVQPAVPLPQATPKGVEAEFREGEACLQTGCHRAAAAMFRSALEKTLAAAGYKADDRTKLYQQIELAAGDGTITDARKRRGHDEIRVLGNDVLHDEWKAVGIEDAIAARDYTQRIIEDFYDHREPTLKQLRAKGRIPLEDRAPAAAAD